MEVLVLWACFYFLIFLIICIGECQWSLQTDLTDLHSLLPKLETKRRSALHVCLIGRCNGFTIKIKERLIDHLMSFGNSDRHNLDVEIDGSGSLPPNIALCAETDRTRAQAQDIPTEDQLFDDAALVIGSEVTALAVLDHDTRDILLELIKRGGVVAYGKISTRCASSEITWYLPKLIDLARSLSVKKRDLPRRLSDNAISDRNPDVRARNFVALQRHFAGTEEAAAAAEHARSSADPALRLEVAVLDQDPAVLGEIASNTEISYPLRVKAVEQLTRASWAEVAVPVLEQLLEADNPVVQRAAVLGLGRFRHRGAVPRLRELATSNSSSVANAAVESLGQIADSAAEPTLIELLKHPDGERFELAVQALGRTGTVAAVQPLLDLLPWLSTDGARTMVEDSVRRIQGRTIGAAQGQLSVVAPTGESGGLSIAEEAGEGGVSLVAEDKAESSAE